MMGNETKTVRCSLNKSLPLDALRRQLEEELATNNMSGVVKIISHGENDQTFKLGYQNYSLGGVKHTFQMVCDKLNISEAKKRGDWTAQYPQIEIKWVKKQDLVSQLKALRDRETVDQKALDRARIRITPKTIGSAQKAGERAQDMWVLKRKIAALEAEIETTEDDPATLT
jgi:hypothetical protein